MQMLAVVVYTIIAAVEVTGKVLKVQPWEAKRNRNCLRFGLGTGFGRVNAASDDKM